MKFLEYYNKTKPEIEERLKQVINVTDDSTLIKIFNHATKGGKRFRPTLCMLCCDALNGNRDKALNYAVIIEFIHNSALVHDDLIDCDHLRRNAPTLWRCIDKVTSTINKTSLFFFKRPVFRKNLSLAILSGDGLLAKALTIIDNPTALKVVSEGIYALLKGAVKEAKYAKQYTKSLYVDTIILKTASLFATACYLGALSSDSSGDQKEACRQYGKNLGILYQVVDDYIDNECPKFIEENIENTIKKYVDECLKYIDILPKSEYSNIMKDAIFTVLEKFSREAKNELRQRKIETIIESLKENS